MDGEFIETKGRLLRVLLLLAIGSWVILLLSHPPKAKALPLLWERCQTGSGAGMCDVPGGVAVDSDKGNVFVADIANNRINVFSPWGTFLKSWGWGVADGVATPEACGPAATPPTTTCQAGVAGVGPGQITGSSRAVAVDSQGEIYVYESISCGGGSGCLPEIFGNRVQKFNPDGGFVLMFGKEVNLTKVAQREAEESAAEPVTVSAQEENLCTAASGDTCGRGEEGSGPGEFGTGPLSQVDPFYSLNIAAGPGDEIYVATQEQIQVFDSSGHFDRSIPTPGTLPRSLAVDLDGNTYLADDKKANLVTKRDPAGAEMCVAKVQNPRSLTVDALGRLYVAAGEGTNGVTVHRFSATCIEDQAFSFPIVGLQPSQYPTVPGGIATSSACGISGNLYYANRAFSLTGGGILRAYFPAPDPTLCPPPLAAPEIDEQYARAVGVSDATVQAKISTRFWPEASYYVEYGTEECGSSSDACQQTALFPGANLIGEADQPVTTAGVTLSGLQPDTTYHYRFVSQSAGGGPVHGIGAEEASGTFTTFPAATRRKTDCPNQTFRSGSSASLPDCRAYEMVSPADKKGGELVVGVTDLGDRASLNLGAGDGERVTYSSYRAFGNSPSSPYSVQYLSERTPSGWSNEGISVPQEGPSYLEGGQDLDSYYKAFDEELCTAWLRQPTNPLLTPDAISGYANLYRRQGCGEVKFEALTRIAPIFDASKGEAPLAPAKFSPEVSGFSEDGAHTIFAAAAKLTQDAPPCSGNGPECVRQVYQYHEGELDLVCIFPNGEPSNEPCWAGSGGVVTVNGKNNLVQNAISADGSRIFWTNKSSALSNLQVGKLYVRIDNAETRTLSASPTRFWAASRDGTRVIYSVFLSGESVGNLYEDSIDGGTKSLIAKQVTSVLGVSEDARRVYFASKEALAGSGVNSEGDSAQAGKANLYYFEEGGGGGSGNLAFIGTLAPEDESEQFGSLKFSRFYQTARVTPDGLHATFTSIVPLTGRDNIDATRGRPVTEVYLYDAVSGTLRCASCSPTNARPQGRPVIVNNAPENLLFGGTIPGWPSQLHPSRVLTNDGSRLFFESYESLVPVDTNGKRDVYEWEEASTAEECEAVGAQLFLRLEGGCISLISSGESPGDSSFIDAGRSGRDVFFATASSLIPQDPGLIDLYDAREGGGFPAPIPPAPACEGESCQGAYAPPQDPTPASANFEGPGNIDERPVKEKHKPKRGKHKKKRKHASKGKQGKNGPAGRAEGGSR
jgi:DNA-binding beta-propeller fold protein YncE